MEFTGILKKVFDLRSGTKKDGGTWQSQEFLVETIEQYPQKAVFECSGDKIDFLSTFPLGTQIKVVFNFKANEWNDRFFNKLSVWKIEKPQSNSVENINSEIKNKNNTKKDLPEFEVDDLNNDITNLPF